MRKDLYKDCGGVKRIASNGMGIFEVPKQKRDGSDYKDGSKVALQVAIKCNIGDRVVLKKGTKRPYIVIKESVWANMPASEADIKNTQTKETPGMSEVFKRIEALETSNTKVNEENKILREENKTLREQAHLPDAKGENNA